MCINDYKPYQYGAIFKGAPHCERRLTSDEIKSLLGKKIWFVRNVFDFDCKNETSFWYIINDKPLKIEDLSSKTRNQVRRALKTLNIRKIEAAEMLHGGYKVYNDSYKRYKKVTSYPLSEENWRKHIEIGNVNFEYWGAYENNTGKMVAYSEVLIQSDMAKYTALKGIPEYLNKYYPFYGLLFQMNEYYIEKRKMLYVTDGARSVTEHSNIQVFLNKFRFRKAYCNLVIKYVFWLKVVVNILYPFRRIMPFKKIKYLLYFEAMQRGAY
ncbi:hypothetical protein [Coprobacter tertius]|uniref:Uncharacterized protein n=1 Tax=Coprobacter tertius TaxID=2944915 RepID=A0ABT1MK74_9BACT|nr:hypothetical protein [Coprobacter tertius]MCP9613012.1 hypothetical protein [Coprobacter tertius]